MNWQKFMLGLILILAIGSSYLVLNNTNKWPHEFKQGLDIQGGMHLVLQAQPTDRIQAITPEVMEAAIGVVRNRVDGLGVSEPVIQPKGEDQIIVDMPGIKDKDEALRVIGTTAVLSFRAHEADFPTGQPAPAKASTGDEWVLTGLEGTHITAARVEPMGTNWAVTVEFDAEGTRLLAETSRELLHKPMGIFLDDRLISDPVIQEPLDSGNARIFGDFDAKEANELMIVLKAGSLPVPLEVIENRSVDASLGAESVRQSIIAGMVGIVLVMVFMVGYYRMPGMIANLALLIYSVMNLAAYKLIPITLTVPGIAGFILSLGMAVDANILIFERTKEELNEGRTLYSAIENGFKRAFSAIFDSNITTLLSCAVLFYFGTGLIKGFALTLAIGVVLSMFTAISATRNLLHGILSAKQLKSSTLFGATTASKIR